MQSYDDFLIVAKQSLANRPTQAIADLGLLDLLDAGADDESQAAAYAFLQAEGHADAGTSALTHIALASPGITARLKLQPISSLAVGVGVGTYVILGPVTASVLVDLPGTGLVLTPATGLAALPANGVVPYAHAAQLNLAETTVIVGEAQLQPLRSAIEARLRLGCAALMIGTMDRLLEDALTHVQVRTQFGQALVEFTPVRDMVAWAASERHQLNELLHATLVSGSIVDPDAGLATLVKALAGTSAHRVAQATLQATGAIGFTDEHAHSWRHQRLLTLDQVAGSTAELTARLGAQVRLTGQLPAMGSLERLAASVDALTPAG